MPAVLELLDAGAVHDWCAAAVVALDEHRDEIDRLNVFPVPDGDTGTNLVLTMRAAADAIRAGTAAGDAAEALQVMAHGALMGARGNSGVIISQLLRGLAEGVNGAPRCDGASMRTALRSAAERAYAAVSRPLEGTILTVARAAAEAAEGQNSAALDRVVDAARNGAVEALRRTPTQLPALARAGVVDAGGRGLVVLLDALAAVVGAATQTSDSVALEPAPVPVPEPLRETGSESFGYEVQYLLDAGESAVDDLRQRLDALGDSVVIVGSGTGTWNVHAHVNDVGAALEAGVEAGRPHRISVVRFTDQMPPTRRTGTAVVAIASGEGLAHLFSGEGVYVVGGGTGHNPSTAEVLAAVRASHAAEIVLLPNSSSVAAVAEAAAAHAREVDGIDVAVVPARSPVQGLAAVAVHDPQRRFGDDIVAMAEAAAATRWAEITVAQREALTVVGRCQPGDVLGLIDGEVVELGRDLVTVTGAVLDRLLGVGAELVTVVVGRDAEPGLAETVRAHVAAVDPLVEVSIYDGGQPHYPLLIGVE